jgi:hypothetical protein
VSAKRRSTDGAQYLPERVLGVDDTYSATIRHSHRLDRQKQAPSRVALQRRERLSSQAPSVRDVAFAERTAALNPRDPTTNHRHYGSQQEHRYDRSYRPPAPPRELIAACAAG